MDSKEHVQILIVDDRPDNAKALELIIAELGAVVCVHSGKDALTTLERESYAVILLDVNMSIMDGFETAELIRSRATTKHTPIIFITSYYDADTHRQRAYTLGAVDYMLAPIIPEILKAKVSVFVDLYRKTEEVRSRAEERVELMQEQMARVAAEAARAVAEDSERRAAYLSNASRLLASSLDYEATLERVAKLTVPEICDWCTVVIVKEDGQLHRLVIANADPVKQAQKKNTEASYLSDPMDPVCRSIQSGESVLFGNLTECTPELKEDLDRHFLAVNLLDVLSFMIVPLRVRGRNLGAMTFKTSESMRRLTQRDLSLAEDLGSRAAVAIDNARLYKEAQESNRMKDDFLAVVSHELRTPLTPILGWTRLLRSERLPASERLHALDIIERNANAQVKLIEDLLDVSRVITGKLHLIFKPVDLSALINMCIDLLRTTFESRSLQISVDLGTEPLWVSGSEERLLQIFKNLFSNAMKFTPDGGSISVSGSRESGKVVVKMNDTGKGINAKFLPFVFDRFRQADSSSTRAFSGLGIGLAIVRHLVELHGGTVLAESGGEGQGATFSITLPAVAASAEMRQNTLNAAGINRLASQPLPPDMRLKDIRVLVVNDESCLRELLTKLLKEHGAVVMEAASVQEAIQQLESNHFQILLTDIGMAGDDGYKLIRRIRNSMSQYSTIPALALTDYTRDEDINTVIAAGYQGYLNKPIDPMRLIASIEALRDYQSPFK